MTRRLLAQNEHNDLKKNSSKNADWLINNDLKNYFHSKTVFSVGWNMVAQMVQNSVSLIKCVQSYLIYIQSYLIYIQSDLICIHIYLTYIKCHIINTQSQLCSVSTDLYSAVLFTFSDI